MNFGLSFLPDASPAELAPQTYFASALRLADLADRGGLRSVKMTEHYLHPYGGYCPSPLTFLAAVAARTSRVRLLTGCVLPVFHHPVQIAAEAAMVHAISAGRLELGLARAYLPYEFETFGIPLDESHERFEATLQAILCLWSEEKATVEGPYFSFHEARSLPPVAPLGRPPIWIAAVRSRSSFAWIGEHGYGLLATNLLTELADFRDYLAIYRDSFVATSPADGDRPRVALSQPLYLALDSATATEEGDRYLGRYFTVWADAASSWDRVGSRDYPGYTGMAHAIRTKTPERCRATGAIAFGDPQQVIDHIHWLDEEFAPDEILWQIDFGAMPEEHATRTLTLFLDEVLPKL